MLKWILGALVAVVAVFAVVVALQPSDFRIERSADGRVKLFELSLRNGGAAPRTCTVTLYVDWVLGTHRAHTGSHIVTSRDPVTGVLIAANNFRESFANRLAFGPSPRKK